MWIAGHRSIEQHHFSISSIIITVFFSLSLCILPVLSSVCSVYFWILLSCLGNFVVGGLMSVGNAKKNLYTFLYTMPSTNFFLNFSCLYQYTLCSLMYDKFRFGLASLHRSRWKWERKCDRRVSISYTHNTLCALSMLCSFNSQFFVGLFSTKNNSSEITVPNQNNLMTTTHYMVCALCSHIDMAIGPDSYHNKDILRMMQRSVRERERYENKKYERKKATNIM